MANVLITGSSRGFGKLTVPVLMERGHHVIATMRDPNGRNSDTAETFATTGATVLELDVTSDDSVTDAVAMAIETTGGVDVVVNNAGVGVSGAQEAFTPDDWRRLFEVNVFGVQRVIRATAPHMRERGNGLLVQVSSLLGRVALPFYGPYNASKWALEAMCENYRSEFAGTGVNVAIVEPGGFLTDFMGAVMTPSDEARTRELSNLTEASSQMLAGFEQMLTGHETQNPELVAVAIADVIDTPTGQRSFRTVVDTLGMGEPIKPYNEQLEQVHNGLYQAFGMGAMRGLPADAAEG